MQVVRGISPTVSGLRLLPLLVGLLLTSTGTGFLVSKWGRYKIFPVIGTALMTLGLFLLSRLGIHSSFWIVSLYLFVLGVGIGASLQVLIIAVQNAVDYKDLGAATSGATFFRSIGGSFGTSVFGAIFSGVLAGDIAAALHGVALPSGLSASARSQPRRARAPARGDPGRLHRRVRAGAAHGVPVRGAHSRGGLRPEPVPEGGAAAGHGAGGGPGPEHRPHSHSRHARLRAGDGARADDAVRT